MQWAVLKCRSPASRLHAMFTTSWGDEFADTSAKRSTNHNRVQRFLEDAEIGFAEINTVGIIRGISDLPACNPILVVSPNAIINPKIA